MTFGKDLETDLSRRDFTINAMAVSAAGRGVRGPVRRGAATWRAKTLDTPLEPEVSFADDPLRMLRAARFVAQLEVTPAPRVVEAIARDAGAPRDRVARSGSGDELS